VLLFVAFYFCSMLYPQKASAASAEIASTPFQPQSYGLLSPVARPIEWTLRQVQSRVTYRFGRSSWGWAIIVATCLLNLLLLPFRILAARNARAMRLLKPQIDALNAKYKGKSASLRLPIDPEQSEAISALYRREKVHPLSGCIPAVMPFLVLAAFYSVLNKLTELHGAQWFWIADLSRPEQLPIRVLPLLMIGTQLLLGRMTPKTSTDPAMNRIVILMPLIFGFMFYGQPSALLLYWLTGNLLAVGTQYWLGKRYASGSHW